MKLLASGEEMKRIDQYTISQIGIPGLVLMERAALATVNEIDKRFAPGTENGAIYERCNRVPSVLVVCGSGNNGGDGLAAARMLHERGYMVDVCKLGSDAHSTDSFRSQEKILTNLGVQIVTEYPETTYDIVVDAIFGVGLSRDVTGRYAEVIRRINASGAYVVAVDIPSGVSATTGKILQVAVRADLTVTFGLEKVGMVFYPGCTMCGEVCVCDIGFPQIAVCANEINCYTFDKEALSLLPSRNPSGNKGTFGKVAVIAGSAEISGAAVLSGTAAYKTGCGMVKVYTHEKNRTTVGVCLPEALIQTYQSMEEAEACVRDAFSFADVILIGPGIGMDEKACKMAELCMRKAQVPMVVDADGLNLLARHKEWLEDGIEARKERKNPLILTPHVKEMSRLTGMTVDQIKEDLTGVCKTFAKRYALVCVLKDARTCVSNGKRVYINTSGNDGMATAGSGDVLAGILAGLAAQNMPAHMTAELGVYIHGLAGDHAAEIYGRPALTAGKLAEQIGAVIKEQKEA